MLQVTFSGHFFIENNHIFIQISLKFIAERLNNKKTLVWIVALHGEGGKLLCETMIVYRYLYLSIGVIVAHASIRRYVQSANSGNNQLIVIYHGLFFSTSVSTWLLFSLVSESSQPY